MLNVASLTLAPRALLVPALALAAGVLARGCDDAPRGRHAPNIAFAVDDADVWAGVWRENRAGARRIGFVEVRNGAERPPVDLSRHGKGLDAPLVAPQGDAWWIAWSHDGDDPGLYVARARGGAIVDDEQRVVEGRVRACRQMVTQGDEVTVAWSDDDGVHLATIGGDAELRGATTVSAKRASDCRVAGSDEGLWLAWIDLDGRAWIAWRGATDAAPRVQALDARASIIAISPAGPDATVLLVPSDDRRRVVGLRVDRDLRERARHVEESAFAVDDIASTQFGRRGFAAVSAIGRIHYAFVLPDGQLAHAGATPPGARRVANVAFRGGRLAVVYSVDDGGGSIVLELFGQSAGLTRLGSR